MRYADTIEQKVKKFMDEHRMLEPGDRVVAGVSGGADSVCLLFVLLKIRQDIPFSLHVVHVNHGIRREAGEDAVYVEELCSRHEIPFTLVEANVRERAAAEKRSEEETGRLVRYEAFETVLRETGANKIAVAHNSNDQAETMLFHLFRGSGLSGLCGIRPVRDHIIRPILCLERKEIEQYLKEKKIAYCQDATNEEDDYTRNRIRHHILPYAETEISRGCVSHMAQTAAMLLETETYLEQQTSEARALAVREDRQNSASAKDTANTQNLADTVCFRISCRSFAAVDPVIGKRLIYSLLRELSPGGRDMAYVHVQDVLELFAREGNRRIHLPYDIVAWREYGYVCLERQPDWAKKTVRELEKLVETVTICPGDLQDGQPYRVGRGAQTLYFQVFSDKNYEDIPQNRYTKWFDYDKMKEPLTIRTRSMGDFLSIRGASGEMIHKSVKDYMVTEKIPRQERDWMPLIAEGNHVLWIVGYRISEYYKVSKNTKRILQVQLRRDCMSSETEEENGRTC